MNSTSNFYSISTTQGNISIWDSQGKGKPVLFLHGNSACKEAFQHQFENELAKKYRFIAMDLAGHGNSDKAKQPQTVYSIEGHAEVIMEIIKKLQLDKPVVVGWSLGGHVGLNLLQKSQKLAGILITGTPPIKISSEGFGQGFRVNARLLELLKKAEFSREEASEFMRAGDFNTEKYPFIVEAALKTDGYAREYLWEANLKGVGGDQKELVETDSTPLCIVQGENETAIKNDYIIEQVKYKNLFDKVHVIKNTGHAAFWNQPQEFNHILSVFLDYVNNL